MTVLSGFLITGILLRCRALIADGASSASVIGRFYARRLLRIAPAFYGLLAVMWLAAIPELRDSLPWHVAYFSNIYFAPRDTLRGCCALAPSAFRCPERL
jgi:peptidoglycan/LPS O-acetylase OafA/YrhL